MADTTVVQNVVKLREDNWHEWIVDLKAILRPKKLWKYTYEQCPDTADSKAQTIWIEKDTECADYITPRIHSRVKALLSAGDFDSGYILYNKLHSLIEPGGNAQFFRLMKELMFATPENDTIKSMDAYLAQIQSLNERIEATKVQFTTDKRALLCLTMNLPAAYAPLVQVWAVSSDDITFEKASTMVREETRRLHQTDADSSSASTGPSISMFAGRGKPHPCKHCGGNHNDSNCWKEHPELKPEWAKMRDLAFASAKKDTNDNKKKDAKDIAPLNYSM